MAAATAAAAAAFTGLLSGQARGAEGTKGEGVLPAVTLAVMLTTRCWGSGLRISLQAAGFSARTATPCPICPFSCNAVSAIPVPCPLAAGAALLPCWLAGATPRTCTPSVTCAGTGATAALTCPPPSMPRSSSRSPRATSKPRSSPASDPPAPPSPSSAPPRQSKPSRAPKPSWSSSGCTFCFRLDLLPLGLDPRSTTGACPSGTIPALAPPLFLATCINTLPPPCSGCNARVAV
mmetsp:Transcript_9777/g.20879  ORF Transcript_9777/g.20879 Transcript_9777/m.20879 type:complete len:235 (-) Transcript_9777:101-805(-)